MMIDFIIMNTTEDTKDFECLTYGFEEGNNILINPSKSAVRRLLRSSTNDLVLFGHGDENGLYNVRMDGYIISSKDVDFIASRESAKQTTISLDALKELYKLVHNIKEILI